VRLRGSALAIGAYPTFLYDSTGGGGVGRATTVGDRVNIEVHRAARLLLVWAVSEPAAPAVQAGIVYEKPRQRSAHILRASQAPLHT
jgi:hypothetical protein